MKAPIFVKLFSTVIILVLLVAGLFILGAQGASAQESSMPELRLQVHPQYDLVYVIGWNLGDQVTMSITDAQGQFLNEMTATFSPLSWDPNLPAADFSTTGFDFRPGQTLSLSGYGYSRTFTIPDPKLTEINIFADTIRGTGTPEAVMWVCAHAPGGDVLRSTTIEVDGSWMVTFAPIGYPIDNQDYADLQPGISGWAYELDGDDVTWAEDWRVATPRFDVRANEDQIDGYEWPVGDTVTLFVNDAEIGSAQVVDNGWTGYVGFYQTGGFDIQPGNVVTLKDGAIVKTTTVTPLEITGFDLAADTVSGIADRNSAVTLWACAADGCFNRHVTADDEGAWIADFAQPGPLDDEGTTVNIDFGTWVDSWQGDGDGNSTMFAQRVPNPPIAVHMPDNRIDTWDWPLATMLNMTVTDGVTTVTKNQETYGAPWDDTNGYTNFEMSPDTTLLAGQQITISGGGFTKAYTIPDLEITGFDMEQDTVSGIAYPGSRVDIWLSGTGDVVYRHVSADGEGIWVADFSEYGDEEDEQNISDIRECTTIDVQQVDQYGNSTNYTMRVTCPSILAFPTTDEAYGFGWEEINVELTLTIGDFSMMSMTYVAPWDPNEIVAHFDLPEGMDLKTGDSVTIAGQGLSATMTVKELAITSVNENTNTISGTAEPGANIYAYLGLLNALPQPVTPDENGNWSASFTDGNETLDIRPGDSGMVVVFGDDGGQTRIDWQAPNARIEADTWMNRYSLEGWAPGKEITITISGPALSKDYVTYFTPTPDANWYDFYPEGVTLVPGMTITASNEELTKRLTIEDFRVTYVDPVHRWLSGTGKPNASFHITCDGDMIDRPMEKDATIVEDGTWKVYFVKTSWNDWTWYTGGEIWQWDEDGDNTYKRWHLPMQVVEAWLVENEIRAYGWPDGSVLTITVDGKMFTAETHRVSWFEGTEAVVSLGDQFKLQPGMSVSVTDGVTSKDMIVRSLKVGGADPNHELVYGTASAGDKLDSHVNFDNRSQRFTTAGENGTWLVDYRLPDQYGNPIDLNPGDQIRVFDRELDRDSTVYSFVVKNPSVRAWLGSWQAVVGYEWEPGDQVTALIYSDPDKSTELYRQTKTVELFNVDPYYTYVEFLIDGFQLTPGQLVVMTNGVITKEHIVQPVTVTSASIIGDYYIGTAEPGAWVGICVYVDNGCSSTTSGEDGIWRADYAGIADITPGVGMDATQYDEDGDGTSFTFYAAFPTSGSVTGEGVFVSPAGAYTPKPDFAGDVSFQFEAKYGKTGGLTGSFQFEFKGFSFQSTARDWMAIEGGRIQLTGAGKVNGKGAYGFMVNAVDGSQTGAGGQDVIRIRIWDQASGEVIYDNEPGLADVAAPTTPLKHGEVSILKQHE